MRSSATTIITAIALACTSTADPMLQPDLVAQLGEPIELEVGQAVTIQSGALTIGFLAVVSDARCPTSVACVWAGDGAVELMFRQWTETIVDTLHTVLEPASVTVGGVAVQLTELAPYPVETGTIPQDEYVVTLTAVEVS